VSFPLLIPDRELARRLAFAPAWVRARVNEGAFGQCASVGAVFFVPASAVCRWLESAQVVPNSAPVALVEDHAPLSALAVLVGCSVDYLGRHLEMFGPRVVRLSGEYRVPASAAHYFLEQHPARQREEYRARSAADLAERLRRAAA
jgi:hypothetical protein